MNADKVYKSGVEPFVSAALGTYYVQDGQTFEKASEIEGKYDVHCKALIQVGLPELPDNVKEAAIVHSFTRKMQEVFAGAFRKPDTDLQAVADNFVETFSKLVLHEKKERAERVKLDDVSKDALKMVARHLAKADALVIADMTKDQVKDYMGKARTEMAGNTKLWQKALKKASEEL